MFATDENQMDTDRSKEVASCGLRVIQQEISRGDAEARRRERMGQIAPVSILRASALPRELFLDCGSAEFIPYPARAFPCQRFAENLAISDA